MLKRAMAAFTSLQQVKLLRLQDEADEEILESIRSRGIDPAEVCLDWEPACSRAVTSLAIALLESSSCRSVRFIGPQVSPESALKLLDAPPTRLSALAARLTCLDVNFHSTRDVTPIMEELSNVFRDFFTAARNLVTIHLGFPTKLPLDLRLELIFHHVQWDGLRTLGIQGWRLAADEIIGLARRHQRQLRELRLRSVYLRDGSRWRDVLAVLHDEMERLERVDLRDVDYANHFDSEIMSDGMEVRHLETETETHPPPLSSHEVTDGDGDRGHLPSSVMAHNNPNSTHAYPPAVLHHQERRWCPEDLYHHHHHYHYHYHALGMTPEALRSLTAEELGDNGTRVDRRQRLLWEAWVVSSSPSSSSSSRRELRSCPLA